MRKTRTIALEIRANGKKPLLLIDISGITGQTSAARSEAKQLKAFGLRRIAVCGGGKAITTVGKYIAKAGGMSSYTKFFRTEKQARQWLFHLQSELERDANYFVRPALSALIIIVCAGVLAGWTADVQVLKAWLSDSSPMNPTNAVIFIIIALAFLLWRKKRMSSRRGCDHRYFGRYCDYRDQSGQATGRFQERSASG